MTVAWMISVLSVSVCLLGAALAWLFFGVPDQADGPGLGLLAGLLFFAALTIGMVSLLLLPMVLRSRNVAPPRSLVIFSVVASLAPWMVLAIRWAGSFL